MLTCDAENLVGSSIDELVAMDCRDSFWRMVHKVLGQQTQVATNERGSNAAKEGVEKASSGTVSGSDPNVVSVRSTEHGDLAYKKRAFEAKEKSSNEAGESVDDDAPPAAKQAKLDEDAELKSPPELLQQIQPAFRSKYVSTSGASSSLDSSMGKVKRKSPTSSESGYRESNDSPEDSNGRSSSVMSNEGMLGQKKRKYWQNPVPLIVSHS